MTGFVQAPGVSMPLSLMTALSMQDMGYSVNPSQADAYTVPNSRRRLRQSAKSKIVQLHDDVLRFKIKVIDDTIGTSVPKAGREAEYEQKRNKFAQLQAAKEAKKAVVNAST